MAFSNLISTIARALVDEPEAVDVQETQEGNSCTVELRVAKADIGKVIGKDGRTAQSIRTLLAAASIKSGRRAHLDILD